MTRVAICLACDDNFIPFTTVTARRISAYSGGRLSIIVVSDSVSEDNKKLAQKFCPQISFIEASHVFEGQRLPVSRGKTRAALLRLFLDEILSDFDRAVYLDGDISPLADVSPLLDMAPKVAPVIVGYDLTGPPSQAFNTRLGMSEDAAYFNSGIAVYDLKAIREEAIFKNAVRFASENRERCRYVDQDSLNVTLNGRWQVLDWRWNALNYISVEPPKQPFIRHFAGSAPWSPSKVGVQPRFIREWRSDLAKSPWSGRFHEQTAVYRLRSATRPVMSGIESAVKSFLPSRKTSEFRVKKNFLRNLPAMLASIEEAAAFGAVAKPLLRFGAS